MLLGFCLKYILNLNSQSILEKQQQLKQDIGCHVPTWGYTQAELLFDCIITRVLIQDPLLKLWYNSNCGNEIVIMAIAVDQVFTLWMWERRNLVFVDWMLVVICMSHVWYFGTLFVIYICKLRICHNLLYPRRGNNCNNKRQQYLRKWFHGYYQ